MNSDNISPQYFINEQSAVYYFDLQTIHNVITLLGCLIYLDHLGPSSVVFSFVCYTGCYYSYE